MRNMLAAVVLVIRVVLLALGSLAAVACASSGTKPRGASNAELYAKYVWPPPPDKPRIQLIDIVSARADVEGESRLQQALIGAGPKEKFDRLEKPYAVEWDSKGRLLVTDPVLGALFRIDRAERRFDVLGTTGAVTLKQPLGIGIGPDGRIYVADAAAKKVIVFDADGEIVTAFGRQGEFENPTDVAISKDGSRLYVVDSKAHKVVVVDIADSRIVSSMGTRGTGDGELNFPTSIALDREGNLLVVDQINTRIQIFSPTGQWVDSFGGIGVQSGAFIRPKDIAVDESGLVYVTDGAFNNVQIFDADLRLMTFVGEGGSGPGRFQVLTGVAVRGAEFALVDQLGKGVQLFRFLGSKTAE